MTARTAAVPNGSAAKRPRVYVRPSLVKGPVLANVTAISMSAAPCWVARAAFGHEDFRWMIFRGWLMDDAPAWFRTAYLRHGAAVGAWVARHEAVRRAVRAAMLPIVRRKATR